MVFEPVTLAITFLFSLAPLLLGFKRKKYFLGILGCFATVLTSSSMHILISIVIAIIFTVLIITGENPKDEKEDVK